MLLVLVFTHRDIQRGETVIVAGGRIIQNPRTEADLGPVVAHRLSVRIVAFDVFFPHYCPAMFIDGKVCDILSFLL